MKADQAAVKIASSRYETILDVGSGSGETAAFFADYGKLVETVSYTPPADRVGDFLTMELPCYDVVWASHVLEHVPDTGRFLSKCFELLNLGGCLAVTVPPLKHQVVGGHVNLFNAGTLLYNLILAGFDCSAAAVKTYGYNISVLVKKTSYRSSLPYGLAMDCGDIEKLAHLFPMPVKQGFDGRIREVHWDGFSC